jgi:hypothetical protein
MCTSSGSCRSSDTPRRRFPHGALLFAFVVCLSVIPGWGQSLPFWHGVLRNSAGEPIAGAVVRLAGARGRAESVTGSGGRFGLALPAGKYRLTLRTGNHKIDYNLPIEIAENNPAVVLTLSEGGELAVAALKTGRASGDWELSIQEIGDLPLNTRELSALLPLAGGGEVTVATPKAEQATGGEKLSSKAVSDLPLNKRDFSALLLLAAGTMTDTNGATNFTQQFAINGQRGVEATFAMDGADISDPEMGGSTFSNFNVDAIQEIHSMSGWMPASVGRGASGFTNIITRSGASGFHGSFFEFVRNSAFDARNFFDHATPAFPGRIPPFRRNQFGFTNGGPVYIPGLYNGRGRTFYFVEYQGFRQVLATTQVMPVPTAAERSGIDVVTYPDGSTDRLNVPVNPSIAAILARYPLPNYAAGAYGDRTYATASKVVTNSDQFSVRIDHKLSPRDQFFARYTMDNLTGPTTNPDQTAIDPAFGIQYFDRERNVEARYTRTQSPRLVFQSLLSVERSTPGFPTPDSTDPAVKFNDGLFEAFNSAGGSVMQSYGNLFQGSQTVAYTRGNHQIQAGFEVRLNRDTTYFGMSPNGEYDFGGGTAYATEAIPSVSGTHDIAIGQPLPDTLSAFLSGSAFIYTAAIAPPYFSGGQHIGPAAISRNNFSLWVQDSWKVTPRFTLDYGLRWELYTPITERARRTAGLRTLNGVQEYVINPQPGYKTNWNGFGPRVEMSWQVTGNLVAHAGGGITVIPPNIWQDNFLTGSNPFVVYPRLVAAPGAPIQYGFQITPAQLPRVYTPQGVDIFASGNSKDVPPNTVMDVNRYEQDIAALTPSHVVSALNLSAIDPSFGNATLYTWTLGFERKIGNLTADASYVGTAAEKLPRLGFPNAYPGASPGFAPHTQFDGSGNVIGGFGVENVVFADAHSSYHALQTSLSGTVGHGGPGIQASFTWSKSIDNASGMFSGLPQNPFDTRPAKGPSTFDVTRGFGLSLIQDLRLEKIGFLSPVSKKVTAGWQLLSISSISSGLPFTVYSGIQQTGYGSNGADRPDLIAKPHLSTSRRNRQDYFGEGANNATDFFLIPIHLTGGTGPNQGRFGTLGRNTFRGPAFYNFDFALVKDTPIGRRSGGVERVDLQFRSEFFNLFNIVNMGLPANVLTGSGFGEISRTAGNSRQIQFSLKLIY